MVGCSLGSNAKLFGDTHVAGNEAQMPPDVNVVLDMQVWRLAEFLLSAKQHVAAWIAERTREVGKLMVPVAVLVIEDVAGADLPAEVQQSAGDTHCCSEY